MQISAFSCCFFFFLFLLLPHWGIFWKKERVFEMCSAECIGPTSCGLPVVVAAVFGFFFLLFSSSD
jgi:hypothetical protein